MKKYFSKKFLTLAFCGVLFTSGLLMAQDKNGDPVTNEELNSYEFWEKLWGEEIMKEEEVTEGKGKPWYKGSGLPIQRAGQKTYAATKSESKDYTIESPDDFLEMLGEGDDNGDFSIGSGGAPDSFSMDLAQDLDLGGATINSIKNFKGVLDGNGKSLKNFTVTGRGFIENLEGTVQNLVLENVTVNYNGDTVAILAANVFGGTITNCLIKDCHLTGQSYLGMFAGNMQALSGASITKCLVVNGDITCLKNTNATSGEHDNINTFVGGMVGNVGSENTFNYNVCMLDMFQMHYEPLKKSSFGRVYGYGVYNATNLNYNYGWGETGFTTWDDDKQIYYNRFYPNWTDNVSTAFYYNAGTNYCTKYSKHGVNIFVGDYNTLLSSNLKSNTLDFWSDVTFDLENVWEFPADARYPRPIGSYVNTNDLVPRRGFESDQLAYSAYGTSKIGTALMFKKAYRKFFSSNDGVELGTDIQLVQNEQLNGVLWGMNPINSTSNFANYYFEKTTCPFDGKGHTVDNLTMISGSGDKAGFIGLISSELGSLKRLSLTNVWFNQSSSTTYENVGVLSSSVSYGGSVKNCYVDIERFYLTYLSSSGASYGGLIGSVTKFTDISKNIINCGLLQISSSKTSNCWGGIIGSFTGDLDGNFTDNYYVVDTTRNESLFGIHFQCAGSYFFYGKIIGAGVDALQNDPKNYCYFAGRDFTIFAYGTVKGETTKGNNELTEQTTALWEEDKMDLDPAIWVIPTQNDKLPYLKKEEIVWDIP